jgi:hypothetical protein
MTFKLVTWIKVQPAELSYKVRVESEKLSLNILGEWIEKNMYYGDKVSIKFPNTYIDQYYSVTEFNHIQKIAELKTFSEMLKAASSKPSKDGMIRLKEFPGFLPENSAGYKSAPQFLLFVVKGNNQIAVEYWFAQFRLFFQLRKSSIENRLFWPPNLLHPDQDGLREVAEKCLGVKLDECVDAVWSFDFM